jgi:hypothetical protein
MRGAKRASHNAWGEINIVSDINENQHHSRPSRFTLLIALGVIVGIGVIVYWPAISTFAHIPQFKQALGL